MFPEPTVAEPPDPAASDAPALNILLVDDQHDKLLVLQAMLADLGERLVLAHSGTEALRCLLEQEFALILLDVNMPVLNGFETAARMRQHKNSELTPIIFISPVSNCGTHASRGYSLGAVDYIVTPIVPEVLQAKVSFLLDLLRKNQRLKRQVEERERVRQQIQQSLQREILLRREIQHRVKNNLQVISSLLFLQSTHVTDPGTREILRESQSRARSIALIHEKLDQCVDLTGVHFDDYVRQLAGDLLRAYGLKPEAVSLRLDAEGIFLGIDAAIPCGLIVNELISNALKYGLPRGETAEICIDLHRSAPGWFTLSVRNSGVGIPKHFDLQTTGTLGLKLVSDLARQLGGTVELESKNGTTVKIAFMEPCTTKRGD
ncbi:MAG: response regulator [Verrucomicrobia bacterium]|nr:response regulator [Verrucomicrobiota bacterium]